MLWQSTLSGSSFRCATGVLLRMISPNFRFIAENVDSTFDGRWAMGDDTASGTRLCSSGRSGTACCSWPTPVTSRVRGEGYERLSDQTLALCQRHARFASQLLQSPFERIEVRSHAERVTRAACKRRTDASCPLAECSIVPRQRHAPDLTARATADVETVRRASRHVRVAVVTGQAWWNLEAWLAPPLHEGRNGCR